MRKRKENSSIVCGGGWQGGSNTIKKKVVLNYGFSHYLYIELAIIFISVGMYFAQFIDPQNILPLAFLILAAISQPYLLYKLIKSYGTKTLTKEVECLGFGPPTPLEKVDPHNLY